MSTLKSLNIQVGTSNTPTDNMTWYQPLIPDGSIRLGVGNTGSTIRDILNVSNTDITLLAPKAFTSPAVNDSSKLLATTEWVNSQMSVTYATQAGLLAQAYNSATTSGTAPTYTASITPAPTLAAGLRVRAKFHTATSTASTLNLNALGAKSIKQYDSTGTLVDASIFVSQLADLEYNGTNWVILNPVPSSAGVGQVGYFAMTSAPAGWLKANGAAVSRVTYAALFVAIGTSFGVGDGSTTFNIPDLRGEFMRGWDDGRGVDSTRAFGSWQSDELRSHRHRHSAGPHTDWAFGVYGGYGNFGGGTPDDPGYIAYTEDKGGAETRPRNLALLACIKY